MRRSVAVLLLAVVGACSSGQDPAVEGASRSTTSTTESSATTATTARTSTTGTTAPQVTTVPAAAANGTCPAIPARRLPDADRPTYQLDLRLDLDRNVVEGRQVVRFTPDLPTDRLVFRLWPNGPRPSAAGARLDVAEVFLGSSAPAPVERPDATTLVVRLDDPLDAGETIEATVPWTLTLPGPISDRISRSGDTVRLGTFHPLLAWEPGVGWATDPATGLFAEATTAPVADYSVGISAPEGITVLANGVLEGGRWQARAMREVAVAFGRFRVVEATANAPGPVQVTVAVEGGMPDDEHAYLRVVTRSLEDFGSRFGPYPYERFTLALTPELGGGIEYPGFVHQGSGTIGRTTPHEVAHMWFYALVGNDQGRDPWLDEGLATWGEARFMGTLPELRSRAIPRDGRGRAGEPMTYWASHPDAYYRSIYVQGALALDALGAPDLVDCALRQLVATNAYGIATNRSAIDAFRTVFPDAEAVLARYGIHPSA
jgi:hypothetical protein